MLLKLIRWWVAVGAVLLLACTPAAAQAITPAEVTATPAGIEAGLLALAPLVIAVSALLLDPAAADAVKQAVPGVVGVIVALLKWGATTWPDGVEVIAANLAAFVAVALTLYGPLSAIVKLVSGGRSINELAGPGAIYGPTYVD